MYVYMYVCMYVYICICAHNLLIPRGNSYVVLFHLGRTLYLTVMRKHCIATTAHIQQLAT